MEITSGFCMRNNLYGISMSQNRHQAIKDVADRGVAYNVPGIVVDGNDVFAVYEAAKEAIKRAREGKGPTLIECKTYRHRGHFEGDPCVYKPTEEQEEWLAKDPIPRFEKYLVENEILTEEKLKKVQNKVESQIDEAVDFANNSPYPELESVLEDVYTDIKEEVR